MRKQDEVVSVEMTKEQLWALRWVTFYSNKSKIKDSMGIWPCDPTIIADIFKKLEPTISNEISRHGINKGSSYVESFPLSEKEAKDELVLKQIAELEQKVAELKATVTTK